MNGDLFIMHDETDAECGRTVIFSSRNQLKMMCESNILYMDGTFKACPKFFTQVYIITGIYRGEYLPLAFVLMSRRTSDAYKKIFRALKVACLEISANGLSPNMLITDFENATASAIQVEFQNSAHYGCYFHYVQALLRFVRTNELLIRLRTDTSMKQNFLLKCMLPFLPAGHIAEAVALIDQEHPGAEQFNNYFLNFWVPKSTMISCYDRILNRTNNPSEGYNSGFNLNAAAVSRNIWAFMLKLRKEEEYVRVQQQRLDAGHLPKTQKVLYQRRDTSLTNLRSQFDPADIIYYLNRAARIMRNH